MFKLWPMAMVLATAASVQAPPASVVRLTLQQAVDQVQADTGGRVLSADTVRSRRGGKYRVKVLSPDGRVQIVEVNAQRERTLASAHDKLKGKETH